MRKSFPDSFTMNAEDISSLARSRLEDVDIDSAYSALMEADSKSETEASATLKAVDLTEMQAWALRALGWVSWAYDARDSANYAEGEDWNCLDNARNCLGESNHHKRKPAEFRAMQAERGKRKRGKISPLKHTLQAIHGYDAFKAMMSDEDALADFNESDQPHPCKLSDINNGKLWYIVRKSGENKSVTLGRIKNIFRYELK